MHVCVFSVLVEEVNFTDGESLTVEGWILKSLHFSDISMHIAHLWCWYCMMISCSGRRVKRSAAVLHLYTLWTPRLGHAPWQLGLGCRYGLWPELEHLQLQHIAPTLFRSLTTQSRRKEAQGMDAGDCPCPASSRGQTENMWAGYLVQLWEVHRYVSQKAAFRCCKETIAVHHWPVTQGDITWPSHVTIWNYMSQS